MRLFDYVWDIFKIATANNTEISNGAQLFYENCTCGYSKYIGAPNLDYSKLKDEFLNEPNIKVQKEMVETILNPETEIYKKLSNFFFKGDKDSFNKRLTE